MDWQIIVLTLGSALITGAVSIIGNIIVMRSNTRKSLLESNEQKTKEIMSKRLKVYDSILLYINYIEKYEDETKCREFCAKLHDCWLNNFSYLSKEVNHRLNSLTRVIEKEDKFINFHINSLREQIKIETDEYYGIKETNMRRY